MKFFRNLKLTKKIGLLSFSFLLFLVIIGVTSIMQVYNVNSEIKELNNSRMVPIISLENVKSDIEYIRTEGSAIMDAQDSASIKTIESYIAARVKTLNKEIAQYKNNPEYKNNSEFKTLLSDYNKFIAAKDTYLKSAESRVKEQSSFTGSSTGTSNNGGNEKPRESLKKGNSDVTNFDNTKTKLISDFDKLVNVHVKAAANTYNESQSLFKRTIVEIILILVLSIFISLILSIIIAREIVAPVKKVTSKLKEISENDGDLTQRIGYDSKDEVGELSKNFDLFMDKLHAIIKEVSISAKTITDLSGNLNKATLETAKSLDGVSATISQIASSTSDSAAAVEETTAALTEAAEFSEATLEATRNTALNSKKAEEAAEEGAAKISQVVTSINEIASSSREVSSMVDDLDKSSKKIGEIIQLITGISEQTNMLALNAAIEAARAGEAGKGFSVVAEEIRKLADGSNDAAAQIAELVKENQVKSSTAVNLVGEVERKVTNGVSRASEVGTAIESIIENVQSIVDQIEQINEANDKQARSSKEIEKVVTGIADESSEIASGTENINSSVQEQLATMDEVEKATDELLKMSKKLNQITEGFKLV
ncbi:methyl-accepting chemotaxis protein [Clostridium hydrogenum]|uniref:methyl-accepting chemotaxis protein n=1 Tax=Clostridium hydrogenum TaxID=2855764 RepID=UPI001F1828A3|nr:HAMP domain-containing methyl-accepting chemotaxis protein [Clostridium hydrogenum]